MTKDFGEPSTRNKKISVAAGIKLCSKVRLLAALKKHSFVEEYVCARAGSGLAVKVDSNLANQ